MKVMTRCVHAGATMTVLVERMVMADHEGVSGIERKAKVTFVLVGVSETVLVVRTVRMVAVHAGVSGTVQSEMTDVEAVSTMTTRIAVKAGVTTAARVSPLTQRPKNGDLTKTVNLSNATTTNPFRI